MELLERGLCKAIKVMKGLDHLSDKERQRELGLLSLEERKVEWVLNMSIKILQEGLR